MCVLKYNYYIMCSVIYNIKVVWPIREQRSSAREIIICVLCTMEEKKMGDIDFIYLLNPYKKKKRKTNHRK